MVVPTYIVEVDVTIPPFARPDGLESYALGAEVVRAVALRAGREIDACAAPVVSGPGDRGNWLV
jgi:hypothetical protein